MTARVAAAAATAVGGGLRGRRWQQTLLRVGRIVKLVSPPVGEKAESPHAIAPAPLQISRLGQTILMARAAAAVATAVGGVARGRRWQQTPLRVGRIVNLVTPPEGERAKSPHATAPAPLVISQMGRTKVTARIDVEVSVQGKTHERWWRLSLVRDLESYAVDLGTPGDEQVATALS